MHPAYVQGFLTGLQKSAKISFSELRAILGGKTPFFHMVSPENVPSFLRNQTVMSAGEAAKRGLLKAVERPGQMMPDPTATLNKTRFARPLTSNVAWQHDPSREVAITLSPKAAKIPLAELYKSQESIRERLLKHYRADRSVYSGKDLVELNKIIARLEDPKTFTRLAAKGRRGKTFAIEQLLGELRGPGNAWPVISLTSKPLRAYGAVGTMATPDTMRGVIGTLGHLTHPALFPRPGPKNLILPRMTGTTVYDPAQVERELAKTLKQQGAIPINARFFRKLKGYLATQSGVANR